MKTNLSNILMMGLALGLGCFAACEDVPAPYEVMSVENGATTEDDPTLFGDGTLANPYSVAKIVALIDAGSLASTDYAYVQGRVCEWDSASVSYGNAYYWISGDGVNSGTRLMVYRGYYTGGDKFTASTPALAEGDSIIIYATYQLYSSKYEANTGSKIAYLNGETFDVGASSSSSPTGTQTGSGTLDDPYNPSKALALVASGNIPSSAVYIKGIVSKITSISTSYGNAEYYLSEDGATAGDQLLVYRGYGLGGNKFTSESELLVGDTLIIQGTLVNYNGTYEVTTGSKIISRNGQTASTETESSTTTAEQCGDGTFANPYNAARALALIAAGKNTTDSVYVMGRICESPAPNVDTESYGNATYYISQDGKTASQLEIFRGYGLGGEKFTDAEDIMPGDSVIVYGVLVKYNSTPEMTLSSRIVYLNGVVNNTGTDPTPNEGNTESGSGESEGGSTVPDVVAGENILSNGDFETWTNGLPDNWKSTSTASSATLSQSTDAHAGTYSVKVAGATSNKRLAYKEITIAAGSYTVSFYAKSLGGATSSYGAQTKAGYVPVTDGSVGSYSYPSAYTNLSESEWTLITYDFELTAETTICPVMMNPKNCGDILVDDFSLIKK